MINAKHLERVYEERSSYGEDNDCTVMALATAFEISYHEAHGILAREGRRNGQGCFFHAYMDGKNSTKTIGHFRYTRVQMVNEVTVDRAGMQYHRRHVTLARFLRDFPKGRFILGCQGHVFTVIDGRIFNLFTGNRTQIRSIWYLEEI